MSTLKVYTDGASRGNPGKAGIGIIISDELSRHILTHSEFIGTATNNQAEYKALLKSLELLKKLLRKINIRRADFFSDSELMVKQLNFDYLVREPELAVMNIRFHVLVKKLGITWSIAHIPRQQNKEADILANKAIDKRV